ncbi:zinc-binding alcohol dehydrogenase family protein [Ktedonosporobacter rubrisoli]|uniref:Zinc-binding alcohol dehydrogenase family protein n=1 Tax=Ktedonosporobacter rubrisoli TaxID=2509675 RepID=A0A4V0YZW2_KTERU|nr:zinc-binding alcohol dehydrogenase family protein [Ktedonosporobacter rubrisoli]QBD81111.1 zinc-binding alcohol dehydrogenase family protein [Ktedonosporobacter rubrisoli]
MKAAVLHNFGEVPRFEDFPDPIPGKDEILVTVKAVALENIDRALASGTHYASRQLVPRLPAIVGLHGIAMSDDGQLVGCAGLHPPYGAMAEKAVISQTNQAPIPAGVDAATAATVPASALTALFPLKGGAKLQAGETVLINGATGFSGKLAVQVARLLGAERVIGTGREAAQLAQLHELGADAVIDLSQAEADVLKAFKREAGTSGYQVILDYIWGHPTELLLEALTPQEISFAKHRVRLVQIGEKAGPRISLAAEALRTSGLEILGAGAGLTPEVLAEGTQQVWEWIKAGKLRAEIEQVPLCDIESAWQRSDVHGKRIVIVP